MAVLRLELQCCWVRLRLRDAGRATLLREVFEFDYEEILKYQVPLMKNNTMCGLFFTPFGGPCRGSSLKSAAEGARVLLFS